MAAAALALTASLLYSQVEKKRQEHIRKEKEGEQEREKEKEGGRARGNGKPLHRVYKKPSQSRGIVAR